MAISVFDLFSIGIGPSSSHTVGPMRAANQFVQTLHDEGLIDKVSRIKSELYGSLGATGKGHGTDKAVLLGLEGELPEDVDTTQIDERLEQIRGSKIINLLAEKPVAFSEKHDLIMHRRRTLPYHSNGMTFRAYNSEKKTASRSYILFGWRRLHCR